MTKGLHSSLADVRFRFERARYRDLYLMSQASEEQVQADIIDTLHLYMIDAIAIDAGVKLARGHFFKMARDQGIDAPAAREMVKFNAGDIPAGLCDLHATLAPSGTGLFIEVKAPMWIAPRERLKHSAPSTERTKVIREAGKASDEQIAFLLSKLERGAIAMVAWSVDDVTQVLGDRLKENLLCMSGAETREKEK